MIGPLPYIGGKRRLARRLISLIPEHVTYVEPFAGGAQLFFHKAPSRIEVLNDLDGEIVSFFRVCKHHPAELARALRLMPASRTLFRTLSNQTPDGLTDVQRAARFFYLQKNGFGANRIRRSYHYCVEKPPNFDPRRIRDALSAAAERLARAQIESLPYQDVLTKYDRPSSFFYIDPPYVGAKLYAHNFADEDFRALAARLQALRGKFILSINEHPVARAAFAGFIQHTVRLSYTATRSVPRVTELLISNFPLPAL
jgi:DNA adenine methylase